MNHLNNSVKDDDSSSCGSDENASIQPAQSKIALAKEIQVIVSGIAHDLNNILSPLSMILPTLREECKNPMTSAMLDRFEEYTNTSADVVKQVLSIPDFVLDKRVPIQTRHLLKNAGQKMRETLPKSTLIKSNIPFNLWLVEANRGQLIQVLTCITRLFCQSAPKGNLFEFNAQNIVVDDLDKDQPQIPSGMYVLWSVGCDCRIINAPVGILHADSAPGEENQVAYENMQTILTVVTAHDGYTILENPNTDGQTLKIYWPACPQ